MHASPLLGMHMYVFDSFASCVHRNWIQQLEGYAESYAVLAALTMEMKKGKKVWVSDVAVPGVRGDLYVEFLQPIDNIDSAILELSRTAVVYISIGVEQNGVVCFR